MMGGQCSVVNFLHVGLLIFISISALRIHPAPFLQRMKELFQTLSTCALLYHSLRYPSFSPHNLSCSLRRRDGPETFHTCPAGGDGVVSQQLQHIPFSVSCCPSPMYHPQNLDRILTATCYEFVVISVIYTSYTGME